MGLARFGGGDNNYCSACGADNAIGCASDCPRYDASPSPPTRVELRQSKSREEERIEVIVEAIDRLIRARLMEDAAAIKRSKASLRNELLLLILPMRR